MTRHGSYWNNIIITRVATSFFRVNLRQGRHRIRLSMQYDCLYEIWYGIFFLKIIYYYRDTGKVNNLL